jgi:hypothetical protein
MDEQKKRRFSDVVGGLVSGVAYARSVADMEAMRIAYYYHQHELLKGMPVPRLRIQRVSISLPIIVTEVIPGIAAVKNPAVDVAKSATDALEKVIEVTKKELDDRKKLIEQDKTIQDTEEEELFRRFMSIVDLAKREHAIERFNDQFKEHLEHAYVALNLSEGEKPSDGSLRDKVGEVADRMVREILTEIIAKYVHQKAKDNNQDFDRERGKKAIQELMDHKITTKLISYVRLAAEESAVTSPTIPPDFYVSVNTDEIKNAGGGPDVVTRLEMILREEGLEWLTEEHKGKTTSKLAPE